MSYFRITIRGIPYPKHKSKGDLDAPDRWTADVIAHTRQLPRVREACIAKITFLLPPDRFPVDRPYGPDLDNLLKRFLDALNETVFSETKGTDSCIVALTAMKVKVPSPDEAGAHLEIMPVSIGSPSRAGS